MKWTNIRLIFLRELRDQLRDRRTLFTIAVLPLLLYPLLGIIFFQVAQFSHEQTTSVAILGSQAIPEQPPLLDGDHFAPSLLLSKRSDLLQVHQYPDMPQDEDVTAQRQRAQRWVAEGTFDAVVLFPSDFAERLEAFRMEAAESSSAPSNDVRSTASLAVPQPEIIVNTASDKSRIAADRVELVLRQWRDAIVRENLRNRNVPDAATQPFRVISTDVAEEQSRRAAMWSKVLPFVVLIWALTGAFYPAVDLCAGEKERGTLETLLCSPASRSEIVWGKLLTIMTFSVSTSVLNLMSMGLTGLFILNRLNALSSPGEQFIIGAPPIMCVVWLLLALLPIAALFSALALAIAAFARSSKEGQYYLMPLLMISLPLMTLPLLPTTQLTLGTSLIPVTGTMLLLRALIEGQYWDALRYTAPVMAITAACCLLAIRWAVEQFNNESVLFRENERWGLGLWLRHLVRDRGPMPSVGEALLCGLLILMIRFFAGFTLPLPNNWPQFATMTSITLLAFVATPALLMAVTLTRNPVRTLKLRLPTPWTIPLAILLAVVIHPLGVAVAEVVKTIYPIGPDMADQMAHISRLLAQAPSIGSILLILALTPAICEELAFRGFILSGMQRTGNKWLAIFFSSIFFGLAHGVWQQSLTACALGLVLGYLAVQTGSLLPAIAFHATYNALSLMMSWYVDSWIDQLPLLGWFVQGHEGQFAYQWPALVASIVLSGLLLLCFRCEPQTNARSTEDEPAALNQLPALEVELPK